MVTTKNSPGCNCCGSVDCIPCEMISSGIKFTVTSDCGTCEATLNFKRYTVESTSYNGTTDELTLTYSISDVDDLGGITFTPGSSVVINGVSYVIVSHSFPTLVLSSATDPGSLDDEEIIGTPDHRDFREIDCEAKVRMYLGRKESTPVVITQSIALGDPSNDGLICSAFWRQDIECYEITGPFVCNSFPPVGPTTTADTDRASDVLITHRFTTVTLTFANITLSGSTIDVEIEVIRYGLDTREVCTVDWRLDKTVTRECVVVPCPPDDTYEPASWFAAQVHDRTTYDWVQETTCSVSPLAYHKTFVTPPGLFNPPAWGPVLGCTIPTNLITGTADTVEPLPIGDTGCSKTVITPQTGKLTQSQVLSGHVYPLIIKSGVVRSKLATVDWCDNRVQEVLLGSPDDDLSASYFDVGIQDYTNAYSLQIITCTYGWQINCTGTLTTMWTNYGTDPGFSSGCPCAGTTSGMANKYVEFEHYWLVEGTPSGTTPITSDWCQVTSVEVEMVAIV